MNNKGFMFKEHKTKKYNSYLEENNHKIFPKKFIDSLVSSLILLMGMPLTNLVSADETFNYVNYTKVYSVGTANNFTNAITEINNAENGNYAIVLTANIELTGVGDFKKIP